MEHSVTHTFPAGGEEDYLVDDNSVSSNEYTSHLQDLQILVNAGDQLVFEGNCSRGITVLLEKVIESAKEKSQYEDLDKQKSEAELKLTSIYEELNTSMKKQTQLMDELVKFGLARISFISSEAEGIKKALQVNKEALKESIEVKESYMPMDGPDDMQEMESESVFQSTNKKLVLMFKFIENQKVELLDAMKQHEDSELSLIKKKIRGGVYGRMTEICTPTETYRMAVTAAMGEHIDSIVVDTSHTGYKCAKHLEEIKHPPMTFIPIGVKVADEMSPSPDGFTRMIDVLRYDAIFANVIRYAVGNTYICDDLRKATMIMRQHGCRVVNTKGTIQTKGVLTGGTTDGFEALLHKWDNKGMEDLLLEDWRRKVSTTDKEILQLETSIKLKKTDFSVGEYQLLEKKIGLLKHENRQWSMDVEIGELEAENARLEKVLLGFIERTRRIDLIIMQETSNFLKGVEMWGAQCPAECGEQIQRLKASKSSNTGCKRPRTEETEANMPEQDFQSKLEKEMGNIIAEKTKFEELNEMVACSKKTLADFELLKATRIKKFLAAYNHISNSFGKNFQQLNPLEGACAYFTVVDESEPFSHEIQCVVEPSAQQTNAAVDLALLLSIHSYKPSALCTLAGVDELVDHLGGEAAARVCKSIQCEANGPQIIWISERHTFHEVADSFVGVYQDAESDINNLALKLMRFQKQ